ncbi:hypothetical protein OPS25_13725 [Alteromonas ponticola]|uniref:Uncharacterized protein n=1 Tax=Alteromonas aquimaris TaxID=2998417 RepID=A0ABT3P9Y4_9ALTE|nr:hypothetical protein [Alteromonas aquimaris]MCW8109563.1 hypothetical protein [Alteromonas aquimaris]
MTKNEQKNVVSSRHQYRLFTVDNVLFDIPSNVYDENAVNGWFEAIIQEGRKFDKWVIFSIPDSSLTISASAATNLGERLPQLRQHGCIGILLLATHTNAKIFHHSVKATPADFDFIVSESMEFLCQQAEQLLGEQGRLNIFNVHQR